MKKILFWYHILITIIFVYVFVQFLTMKRKNIIYRVFADYIFNRYCIILYIILSLLIMKFDIYTSILLLVLIIGPFKVSFKEYFDTPPTIPTTPTTPTIPTIVRDGIIIADIPVPTMTSLQDSVNNKSLENIEFLGIDDRFKMDDVVVKDILRQIKSQVDFDPYKTNLSKEVIYEIYNKYFDNDIFIKLKNNNDDSKTYLAAGNFNYVPREAKADYDLVTYQNLTNNSQIGIDPLADGIINKTKINRG